MTILERGIAAPAGGTDIVQLDRRGIDDDELLRSARTVTQYRGATRTRRASPGRLWRSRCENGRPDTDAASTVGDIGNQPMSGGNMDLLDAETSFRR